MPFPVASSSLDKHVPRQKKISQIRDMNGLAKNCSLSLRRPLCKCLAGVRDETELTASRERPSSFNTQPAVDGPAYLVLLLAAIVQVQNIEIPLQNWRCMERPGLFLKVSVKKKYCHVFESSSSSYLFLVNLDCDGFQKVTSQPR